MGLQLAWARLLWPPGGSQSGRLGGGAWPLTVNSEQQRLLRQLHDISSALVQQGQQQCQGQDEVQVLSELALGKPDARRLLELHQQVLTAGPPSALAYLLDLAVWDACVSELRRCLKAPAQQEQLLKALQVVLAKWKGVTLRTQLARHVAQLMARGAPVADASSQVGYCLGHETLLVHVPVLSSATCWTAVRPITCYAALVVAACIWAGTCLEAVQRSAPVRQSPHATHILPPGYHLQAVQEACLSLFACRRSAHDPSSVQVVQPRASWLKGAHLTDSKAISLLEFGRITAG
jgi:hypothetical protein